MVPDRESPGSESPSRDASDWIDACGQSSEPRRRDVSLEMAVVEYAHRPDRCTVYPPGLTAVERMSTWMTVDLSTTESLAAMR